MATRRRLAHRRLLLLVERGTTKTKLWMPNGHARAGSPRDDRGPVARLAPNRRRKMPVCSTFGIRLSADLPCGISAGGRREAGGRLCQDRQQKIPICRMFSTGATGLEPATSGVTGRVRHNDARRRTPLNVLICRHFSFRGWLRCAWLSQSADRGLGHEWTTNFCLQRQRAVPRSRQACARSRGPVGTATPSAHERSIPGLGCECGRRLADRLGKGSREALEQPLVRCGVVGIELGKRDRREAGLGGEDL